VAAATSARELEQTRVAFVEELERKNRELEAFSYSVSHDLRGPLRRINGFVQILMADYAGKLDAEGQDYLRRLCQSTQRMGQVIDDLLLLSRISRAELNHDRIDFSSIARGVLEELKEKDPQRQVTLSIEDHLVIEADGRLMRVVFDNLLGNAWKFTSKVAEPRIEFGAEQQDGTIFFVRDNGAGFDMSYSDKLFRPFERLHSESDFPGTGIGLATVHRIIDRHGGRVWAESAVGKGATFYFSIPPAGS
jgi:light-regulated signal transduction histidine kinase (bacteriophytochrome)